MRSLRIPFALVAGFLPAVASAHEVYVLRNSQIAVDLTKSPFSFWSVMGSHGMEFAFWTFIAILTVFVVFFASVSHRFEKMCSPYLMRLKHYAPAVARVTIGFSFLAWAYYQSSFGPELPLAETFGASTTLITALLVLCGTLIIAGLYTRIAALIVLLIFTGVLLERGMYLLTYANYFGEVIILLLLGNHRDLGKKKGKGTLRKFDAALQKKVAPYSFTFLRVCFGASLLYASLFAKFVHNNLALQVASLTFAGHTHSLAEMLGFEPHFLVLGAGIIEVVIALFFIFGIEIRFTALFLEFWLTLSLLYFGEVVWPHIILIGIPLAFILYGYDRYSIEGLFFKKGRMEPVF